MAGMVIDLIRLGVGLLMLLFHQQLSDYVLNHERRLVVVFQQRGVPLPAAPTTETSRTIYFCLGTFIVLWQLGRIWLMLHH